jgi:sorting nexin-4
MSIEVRDPVKEHEGSKDMFVSYAVRTKVCFLRTQSL